MENIENKPYDENGFCKCCGWECGFQESHILYYGGSGCEYIRSKYIITVEEEEECFKAVDKSTLQELKVYF